MIKLKHLFLLGFALIFAGCGESELTTEEKLIGNWLIANVGNLQPYLDGTFPNTPSQILKNSKMIIRPDGTIKGIIEKVERNPRNTKDSTFPDIITILDEWNGHWQLMPDQASITVEGTTYERPWKMQTSNPNLCIRETTPKVQKKRGIQFVNEMPIEFLDERTLNIISENTMFQFKLISREVE